MIRTRPMLGDAVVLDHVKYRITGFEDDHALLRCHAGGRSKVLLEGLEWDPIAGVWRA